MLVGNSSLWWLLPNHKDVPVVDLCHEEPLFINVNCVHLIMIEALLPCPCSPPLGHAEALEGPLEHLLLIQVDLEAASVVMDHFILLFL